MTLKFLFLASLVLAAPQTYKSELEKFEKDFVKFKFPQKTERYCAGYIAVLKIGHHTKAAFFIPPNDCQIFLEQASMPATDQDDLWATGEKVLKKKLAWEGCYKEWRKRFVEDDWQDEVIMEENDEGEQKKEKTKKVSTKPPKDLNKVSENYDGHWENLKWKCGEFPAGGLP